MKSYQHPHFPGITFPRPLKALGWPVAVSLLFITGVSGQVATAQGDKAAPAPQVEPLLAKVMTDLPHYGDKPAPAPIADPKPVGEVTSETVHLVPFVVVGDKGSKLRGVELDKAFASEIFKRYDYSAFSLFQHREEKRLLDMASLQNYSDNLMLVGDVEGSRAIKKESNRLFLRTHDPESEYVDSVFNPRNR